MSKQNAIQKSQNREAEPIFRDIRKWASEKGIYKNGDLKTQALKLIEEAGELCKAILNDDECEIIDGIGDCGVVLTNIAELADFRFKNQCEKNCNEDCLNKCMEITFENCIGSAYDTIKNRTGKIENGTFVKDLFEKCEDCEDIFDSENCRNVECINYKN